LVGDWAWWGTPLPPPPGEGNARKGLSEAYLAFTRRPKIAASVL
jgi:hypothetical protein